jgi:hypothetical protein
MFPEYASCCEGAPTPFAGLRRKLDVCRLAALRNEPRRTPHLAEKLNWTLRHVVRDRQRIVAAGFVFPKPVAREPHQLLDASNDRSIITNSPAA